MSQAQVASSGGTLDGYIGEMKKVHRSASAARTLDNLQASNAAAAAIKAQFITLPQSTWASIVGRCVVQGISQELVDEIVDDCYSLDRGVAA